MSTEQATQKREMEKQRDELNRQYNEIKSLQAQVSGLELTGLNAGNSGGPGSSSFSQLRSGPPSPESDRYSPIQSMESPRHSLYSSSPVDQYGPPPSGLVLPQLPPRRRVTMSELHQAQHVTAPSTIPSHARPSGQPMPHNYSGGSQMAPTGNLAGSQGQQRLHHSSMPSLANNGAGNGPFHALAAASGVLLPEGEVREIVFLALLCWLIFLLISERPRKCSAQPTGF